VSPEGFDPKCVNKHTYRACDQVESELLHLRSQHSSRVDNEILCMQISDDMYASFSCLGLPMTARAEGHKKLLTLQHVSLSASICRSVAG